MSLEAFEDGLIIDTDTGELIEVPDGWGIDPLHRLALAHRAATDEEKGWGDRKRALAVAIKRELPDQRMAFEDVVARVQANPPAFNRPEFCEWVEEAEITYGELKQLLKAATGFELAAVPDDLRPEISTYVRSTGSHVRTERVRQRAPRRMVIDPESTVERDLERSLEVVS